MVKRAGLASQDLSFNDDALRLLISGYTMEGGVRQLERGVKKIVAKAVLNKQMGKAFPSVVTPEVVVDLLGPVKIKPKQVMPSAAGRVNGLYFSEAGGGLLPFEVVATKKSTSGASDIKLITRTNMKEMMQDSLQNCIGYVKKHAGELGIELDGISYDLTVSGIDSFTPVDGPSAGAALTTAMISAITGRKIRGDVAMTGTMKSMVDGYVGAIGGLDQKLLGALNGGAKKALIPKENTQDNPNSPLGFDIKDNDGRIIKLPDHVLRNLEIVPVETMDEVLDHALEPERPSLINPNQNPGPSTPKFSGTAALKKQPAARRLNLVS